jgi:hypothetical protein
MTRTFWKENGVDLELNVLRHAVIAGIDGWAYFPIINPGIDWGAAIAAVSDQRDDLAYRITMTAEAKQQRISANSGRPLEFQTVPALCLKTLLAETGEVDLVYSDIQGSEADVLAPYIEDLTSSARFCCVATHGPHIEERLASTFALHGWEIECAFPCHHREPGIIDRDGTFIWSNPKLTAGAAINRFAAGQRPQGTAEVQTAHLVEVDAHPTHLLVTSVKHAFANAWADISNLDPDILSMPGMSGRKYRRFINNLVSGLPEASYLEVGAWAGSTLCSAINRNRVRAVAIDDWSQFGGAKEAFLTNVARFKTEAVELKLIEQDFRTVDFASLGRHCVYLFDGPHDFDDHYDGVALARPALLPCFVLIVDDWNWLKVREGTAKSLQALGMSVLYSVEVRTTTDDSHPSVGREASNWHNGYFIGVIQQPPTDTR